MTGPSMAAEPRTASVARTERLAAKARWVRWRWKPTVTPRPVSTYMIKKTAMSCQPRNEAQSCHATKPRHRNGAPVTIPVMIRSRVSCAIGWMSSAPAGVATACGSALIRPASRCKRVGPGEDIARDITAHATSVDRIPMALSVQLGLLLALATAFASIVGFLLKARGAVESPDVDWRRPLRSSLVLFRSRTYTIGMLVAMASWGLHVGALSLAPISLVQTVIAGGLVLLTVAADRLFGQDVTRREWVGVALTAAGLAVLAATMSGTGHEAHNDYGAATLALYAGTLSVVGLAAGAAGWQRRPILVAVGAGLLWGASDTTIKA